MRKSMWIPVAILTVLCVAAPAVASKARVAKAAYTFDLTQGGSVWIADDNAAVTSSESATFETKRSDKMISVVVEDDSAASVAAAVWQEDSPATVFCDEVMSVPVTGGQPVHVRVILDLTPAPSVGCASPEMPTTGTVTATFTGGKMQKHGHKHHH